MFSTRWVGHVRWALRAGGIRAPKFTTPKDRALNAVQVLRECYVCDSHEFDEALAKKFLRHFDSKMTRNSRVFDEFVRRYGLSYDWFLDGNISVMIASMAARAHQQRDTRSTAIVGEAAGRSERAVI